METDVPIVAELVMAATTDSDSIVGDEDHSHSRLFSDEGDRAILLL
jgi:hypothetical protein